MPTRILRICSSEVGTLKGGESGAVGAGVITCGGTVTGGLELLVVTTGGTTGGTAGGTTGVLPVSLRMLKSMDFETEVEAKMVGRSLESCAQRQSNKLLESSM